MIRRLVSCLLLIAGFVAAGRAAEPPPFGDGRLWRVERDGQAASHIFGTMHLSDPEITVLPPPVAAAFDGSTTVAGEIVIDAPTAIKLNQALFLPAGQRLDGLLTAAQMAKVEAAAKLYHMPLGGLLRYKPWAVMAFFSVPKEELQRAAAGSQALDAQLQIDARAAGKRVVGLETVDEQIRVIDGLEIADQVNLLELTLDSILADDAIVDRMRDLYVAGDLGGLWTLYKTSFEGAEPTLAARFDARFITDRNRLMVERMQALLTDGGAFIAVGALHLPGEEGILNLLARQGYAVTPAE